MSTPPFRRIPPLQHLKAFEAAARLCSFALAASELKLTQSAISHQIKSLEEHVGVALFRRGHRRVTLTDEGHHLAKHTASLLESFQSAISQMVEPRLANTLTLHAFPAFAMHWLMERLPDFSQKHADIDLLLRSSLGIADLVREEADIAIRYGRGGWANLLTQKLLDDELTPMCSSKFNGGKLPKKHADLLTVPLINHTHEPWSHWFSHIGMTSKGLRYRLSFMEESMLMASAVAGHGAALLSTTLTAKAVRDKQLVRLFPEAVPAQYAYYLAWPPHHNESVKLHRFRAWTSEQIEDYKKTI
jgi:LysR family transcriptional regulator, glycine cleavage system transcriptional activator